MHRQADSDLHLWLDPALAKRIVTLTADALADVDPSRAERYQKNAGMLLERLERLDQRISQQLAPVKNVPYIVFHAAYQYFEAAYDLNAVGSITIDPERKPGARRIREMRGKSIN